MSDVRESKCTVCGGSGKLPSSKLSEPTVKCHNCNGSGKVYRLVEKV